MLSEGLARPWKVPVVFVTAVNISLNPCACCLYRLLRCGNVLNRERKLELSNVEHDTRSLPRTAAPVQPIQRIRCVGLRQEGGRHAGGEGRVEACVGGVERKPHDSSYVIMQPAPQLQHIADHRAVRGDAALPGPSDRFFAVAGGPAVGGGEGTGSKALGGGDGKGVEE